MPIVNNDCDPAEGKCLEELIQEINDELTVACQIPFTVPKKELARIIERAKKYFYKIYEYSVEEMYLALPGSTFKKQSFRQGLDTEEDPLNKRNLDNTRGIVMMPKTVYAVNAVYEIGGFSGEDGGFGSNSFSYGDVDFSLDKFIIVMFTVLG